MQLELAAIPSPGLLAVTAVGLGSLLAILGGALALGIRHGIDWDHIAAITDITSTITTTPEPRESWLTREPAAMLTDESGHGLARAEAARETWAPEAAAERRRGPAPPARAGVALVPPGLLRVAGQHRRAFYLGTLYALGHGSVVTLLGLLAILAAQILPEWVDPLMARIVGVTLVFLGVYLFYSLYRFFRGAGPFRIRSRWMLVFAAARLGYRRLVARLQGSHEHHDLGEVQQYGARTAFAIGMIHGVGAETGTQVLIIATAVGAGSKPVAVTTLLVFVSGILVSNSVVTILTTGGFLTARRRQWIYVAVGFVAAVFSLVVGLTFLFNADLLPSLDRYFRWIGGPVVGG